MSLEGSAGTAVNAIGAQEFIKQKADFDIANGDRQSAVLDQIAKNLQYQRENNANQDITLDLGQLAKTQSIAKAGVA